jgi:hypothetical protein
MRVKLGADFGAKEGLNRLKTRGVAGGWKR